ncbi:SH3 domain-containing protein [Helicobacter sp. 14348-15]|uniref:SH3 domain-containing protein n=1 Tax=Helicobacter colisuis TaxID=2949739 RepID=UPI00202B6800|nr:SH3 domain-containing protein [Helicobacter colisuis]MCL9820678.1 SH3 domain-containing protein [Helicobacter colisuis]
MLSNIKRFFKIYPLPIFVLLLVFTIYYSIFEVLKKQDLKTAQPITEAELMQNEIPKESPITPKPIQESKLETPQPKLATPAENKMEEKVENNEIITSKVPSLNIRQEPNVNSPIIGKLTPHIQAIILEDDGKWLLIGANQNSKALGWVLKSYTKILPQKAILQETQEIKIDLPRFFTSLAPRLNIRQTPSTEAKILGSLTPEDSVEILENTGEWVKIQDINPTSNKSGWVMKKFLKEI